MQSISGEQSENMLRQIAKKILPQPVVLWLAAFEVDVKTTSRTLCFENSFLRRIFKHALYPRHLAIFLTTRCNIRCMICRREDFQGKDLEFDNIRKLAAPIRYARTIDLTGWGECLLYPRFAEVVRYVLSVNPNEHILCITTNGTLLSSNVAELIRGRFQQVVVSLNAASEETYNRDMKYGDFHRTLLNIKQFMTALTPDDRQRVQLHFVAHADNYTEIPRFVRLAHDLGIFSVSIGHYLVGSEDHIGKAIFHYQQEYNAMMDEAELLAAACGIIITGRRFFREAATPVASCSAPFDQCYVQPDGEISSPCCYAGYNPMGNVYASGFDKVWFGKAYQKLRRSRYLPACKGCTPFIPLDDFRAHFAGDFKIQPEFSHLLKESRSAIDSDKE
jgi:MoaA/NifB/PqqE/SkfB family radical SAM enzyme